ncbi:unnamed protein product [Eruca vesicaria subsp. sativa]|uniref:Uncharacterized protein n=1 Tax=Eruca vesicaria subsp. sativa TaxID=29727 RepID=A0ABC8KGJ7_ERUVS|nr:unnamed protein product [Eruca vesicaria subsp. sativa]
MAHSNAPTRRRFGCPDNVRKGGELMSVDMLFVDANSNSGFYCFVKATVTQGSVGANRQLCCIVIRLQRCFTMLVDTAEKDSQALSLTTHPAERNGSEDELPTKWRLYSAVGKILLDDCNKHGPGFTQPSVLGAMTQAVPTHQDNQAFFTWLKPGSSATAVVA